MSRLSRIAAAPALFAALSLTATPAVAAELPLETGRSVVAGELAWSPGGEIYANHRWYRYRRNRVDVGDVLTGVLIIGGIAAIANAVKRDAERDDYRYRSYPSDYPDDRYDYDDARGIDRSVSMCVRAVERDARVAEVDSVNRDGEGWQVTGSLYNGEGFTCSIGRDGRIEAIDYSGGEARWEDEDRYGAEARDRQWDDERYSSAWAEVDAQREPQAQTEHQPEYPGGPLDGDLDESQIGNGYRGAD